MSNDRPEALKLLLSIVVYVVIIIFCLGILLYVPIQ